MKRRRRRGVVVRAVTLSRRTPRGGKPRLWAYGWEELAALLGTPERGLREAAAAGGFDPGDLEAVVRLWFATQEPKNCAGLWQEGRRLADVAQEALRRARAKRRK